MDIISNLEYSPDEKLRQLLAMSDNSQKLEDVLTFFIHYYDNDMSSDELHLNALLRFPSDRIPLLVRYQAADTLYYIDPIEGREAYLYLASTYPMDRFQLLAGLYHVFETLEKKKKAFDLYRKLLEDDSISLASRFDELLKLYYHSVLNPEWTEPVKVQGYYVRNGLLAFIEHCYYQAYPPSSVEGIEGKTETTTTTTTTNMEMPLDTIRFDSMRYCILSAQMLLVRSKQFLELGLRSTDLDRVYEVIYEFASDPLNEYNLRSDAADLLLLSNNELYRLKAHDIIDHLGAIFTPGDSVRENKIYHNLQNAHLVDESVNQAVMELFSHPISKSRSFEEWSGALLARRDNRRIRSSLYRIERDQLIYPGATTLRSIFIRVCEVIDELDKSGKDVYSRLLEELEDMADTCSSGHVSRLLNALSGFSTMGVGFTLKDELKNSILVRLEHFIMEEVQDPKSMMNKGKEDTAKEEKGKAETERENEKEKGKEGGMSDTKEGEKSETHENKTREALLDEMTESDLFKKPAWREQVYSIFLPRIYTELRRDYPSVQEMDYDRAFTQAIHDIEDS